jgi:6-phosphofructokinase 1
MNTKIRRIAINVGAGFIPGINTVVAGATLAAGRLGWEVVGIRDGFDGLLHPEHHPDGGLVPLDRQRVEHLDPAGVSVLGQSPREDPFHVRQVNEDGLVEEVDMSDVLLERFKEEKFDALISVVGGRGLSILHKLHRKGLNAVCIPRSIENDIAATMVSFGFNSTLSFTIEMLDRIHQAARSARRIGVVEVLGEHSGWLALQAGIAVVADAILIPEIPCDLHAVAAKLKESISLRRPYGLVVVAEGARLIDEPQGQADKPSANPLKDSLSPLASGDSSEHVIQRSGQTAKTVAKRLLIRGGPPTAVDRQLGLAYGAGAVEALNAGEDGVMVAFTPPIIDFVPLPQAINKVRTVPADSEFMQIARSLGISLGGAR